MSNPVPETQRRPRGRRASLAAALAVGLVLIACGDDGGSAGADESESGEASAAEPGALPVTIEHKLGTTEIEEAPQRVVTVGFTDQDSVLAFGVRPVGVRDWYGDQPHATFPWAQDELGDAEPEIVGDGNGINFEAVAALRPDLIVAIYEEVTEDAYATLSEIAPTITQSADYEQYAQPWQETTRMVGRALGQPERADELVGEVEDTFAQAREEHPELEGTTAAMAQFGDSSGTYFLLHPEDPKARFLTELGFVIPDEITDTIVDEQSEELSFERLDLVDQEVAVWLAGVESPELVAELQESPLYQQLDVAREGRDLFLEAGVDELGWSTVLSLPVAVDEIVPQLADMLAGTDRG